MPNSFLFPELTAGSILVCRGYGFCSHFPIFDPSVLAGVKRTGDKVAYGKEDTTVAPKGLLDSIFSHRSASQYCDIPAYFANRHGAHLGRKHIVWQPIVSGPHCKDERTWRETLGFRFCDESCVFFHCCNFQVQN